MPELPDDVVDEARRLTRLARDAVDENEAAAYRRERDDLLAQHDYVARVRGEETVDVLVCHPAEWVDEGEVRVDRIEDTDRAAEVPLDGAADEDRFDAVDEHNRDVVAAVEARAGPEHAANVAAFADFMGNHYVRRVESATSEEIQEFLEEYFPRNAWPSACSLLCVHAGTSAGPHCHV
jgi:hypothetical protein